MPIKNLNEEVRPVNNERMRAITDCCDTAFVTLNDIKDKVSKIINFHQSSAKRSEDGDKGGEAGSGGAGGGVRTGDARALYSEVGRYLAVLENLVTINKGLEQAAQEVKQLCQEAHLLLSKRMETGKSIGLGMGGRTTTEQEEDEKD